MNLNEAYKTLELSPNATPEEAKKKYRDLTKRYHPDVNKEPNAEDRFKKINEAYQCVKTGKGTDREESIGFNPFSDDFNPFQNPFQGHGRRRTEVEPIVNSVNISFKDSVLGCKQDITFSRRIKCQECNGQGAVKIDNGCTKCNGTGMISNKQGSMLFCRTCDKCGGRIQANHVTNVIDPEQ